MTQKAKKVHEAQTHRSTIYTRDVQNSQNQRNVSSPWWYRHTEVVNKRLSDGNKLKRKKAKDIQAMQICLLSNSSPTHPHTHKHLSWKSNARYEMKAHYAAPKFFLFFSNALFVCCSLLVFLCDYWTETRHRADWASQPMLRSKSNDDKCARRTPRSKLSLDKLNENIVERMIIKSRMFKMGTESNRMFSCHVE